MPLSAGSFGIGVCRRDGSKVGHAGPSSDKPVEYEVL